MNWLITVIIARAPVSSPWPVLLPLCQGEEDVLNDTRGNSSRSRSPALSVLGHNDLQLLEIPGHNEVTPLL